MTEAYKRCGAVLQLVRGARGGRMAPRSGGGHAVSAGWREGGFDGQGAYGMKRIIRLVGPVSATPVLPFQKCEFSLLIQENTHPIGCQCGRCSGTKPISRRHEGR